MNLVLDASVALCWLFLDGKPAERAYAQKVLAAMQQVSISVTSARPTSAPPPRA